MKKNSENKSSYPKPFRFTIYILAVTILGFVNWKMTYAIDPETESAMSLGTRLAEAVAPIPDPEPELEGWILSFYENYTATRTDDSNLETRLAEALKPVPEPEPELEGWILTLSEDLLSGTGR